MGKKDLTAARVCVERMIAKEKDHNRHTVAQSLEYALRSWPTTFTMVELPQQIQKLVWADNPKRSLSDLWLDPSVGEQISAFLRERALAEKIREAELSIRNRILFHGPSGNGKTSLAGAIAKECGLQLLTLKLSGIIESHIGGTGKHLRDLFSHAMQNECLLFLDELDSIGTARAGGEASAGREYNLIVNQLIMLFDRIPDSSIIVGATNRIDAIDTAVKRRFNLTMELCPPSTEQVEKYISTYQRKHGILFPTHTEESFPSWAAVEEYCFDQHRNLILAACS